MYKAWIKGSGAGYPWCLKEGGAYVRTEKAQIIENFREKENGSQDRERSF